MQPLDRDQRGSMSDDLRLSDIEDRVTCRACGKRGADVRPDWITQIRKMTITTAATSSDGSAALA